MVHPWQHAEGLFGFGGVDLNTILEQTTTHVQRTTGPAAFLDSWQLAEGMFGFGVYLNTILEQTTTCVQRVRLYSLILC